MVTVANCPRGREEIIEEYGNPESVETLQADPNWREDNLIWMELPVWVEMYTSWGDPPQRVHRLYGHKWVVPAMVDALSAIWKVLGDKYLREHTLNRYGGIYNYRMKTGSRSHLSTHSWGIAIDLNPHLWSWGRKVRDDAYPTVWHVFDLAFRVRGFVSGVPFPTPDPMHWQAAEGY